MSVILGGVLTLALPFLAYWIFGWPGVAVWGLITLFSGLVGLGVAWDHERLAGFGLGCVWPWLLVEWAFHS